MNKFKGSMVAIVTPMKGRKSTIDYGNFFELLKWQIQQNTDAIIVAGSTGEGATLTKAEFIKLLGIAKEVVGGKIPLIAGTGTNSTNTTIEQTKLAEQIGVDAALIVTPYYNKPTQLGLELHFSAIANSTTLPIILYNVPSRTGCDLLPETIGKLSNIDNIVGVKEATGDLSRVKLLKQYCHPDFILLSGDDFSFLEFMLLGGDGVISVTANIVPEIMSKICSLMLDFKINHNVSSLEEAKAINGRISQLHRALMIQSNPIPVKWLLSYIGKIEEVYRLPLTTLDLEFHYNLIEAYNLTIM